MAGRAGSRTAGRQQRLRLRLRQRCIGLRLRAHRHQPRHVRWKWRAEPRAAQGSALGARNGLPTAGQPGSKGLLTAAAGAGAVQGGRVWRQGLQHVLRPLRRGTVGLLVEHPSHWPGNVGRRGGRLRAFSRILRGCFPTVACRRRQPSLWGTRRPLGCRHWPGVVGRCGRGRMSPGRAAGHHELHLRPLCHPLIPSSSEAADIRRAPGCAAATGRRPCSRVQRVLGGSGA